MNRFAILVLGILITFALVGVQALFSFDMSTMEMSHGEMNSMDCTNMCLSDAIEASSGISVAIVIVVAIAAALLVLRTESTSAFHSLRHIISPPDPRLARIVVRRE